MTSQRLAGQRFRQRKLSVKQNLSILHEHEVEQLTIDDEAQRHIPKVETGVEKGEEIEHHLQAAIQSQAGGGGKAAYIPTPPTNVSGLQYERLYRPQYRHPQTYIRFSSTVEDCVGSSYCMDSDDVVFLAKLNYPSSKKSPTRSSSTLPPPCTEDQFEEAMSFFENQSQLRQPFAAVDNAPVLPYAEMEAGFDDTIDELARRFAKDIYEHWRVQRLKSLNHPLMPALKFERNVETDDSDPYVCFRRREVRQVRKTRARDAQIAEKLRKLRSELEQARQLMHFTKQRELYRRDQMILDRQIFEQRAAVKDAKRNLGIKGDEDDLVHQKPVPKPRPKAEAVVRNAPGAAQRQPPHINGRVPDSDLPSLAEERAKRELEIQAIIQESMAKHKTWNTDWVDRTWRPITPPLEDAGSNSSFRTAVTEFLPTPPASASTERSLEAINLVDQSNPADKRPVQTRYASPPAEIAAPRPSYRRRRGRGGRLFIDRRGLSKGTQMERDDMSDRLHERMEFDLESDEDTPMYQTDPYDNWNIRYRLLFTMPGARDPAHNQRLLEENQKRLAVSQANGGAQGSGVKATRAGNATGGAQPQKTSTK